MYNFRPTADPHSEDIYLNNKYIGSILHHDNIWKLELSPNCPGLQVHLKPIFDRIKDFDRIKNTIDNAIS